MDPAYCRSVSSDHPKADKRNSDLAFQNALIGSEASEGGRHVAEKPRV